MDAVTLAALREHRRQQEQRPTSCSGASRCAMWPRALGHTDPAMTLRTYAQAITEGQHRAAKAIEDLLRDGSKIRRPAIRFLVAANHLDEPGSICLNGMATTPLTL